MQPPSRAAASLSLQFSQNEPSESVKRKPNQLWPAVKLEPWKSGYYKGTTRVSIRVLQGNHKIRVLRLMDKILHDPKDPKLWELWYIPYNGSCRILSINRITGNLCETPCLSSHIPNDGCKTPVARIETPIWKKHSIEDGACGWITQFHSIEMYIMNSVRVYTCIYLLKYVCTYYTCF